MRFRTIQSPNRGVWLVIDSTLARILCETGMKADAITISEALNNQNAYFTEQMKLTI